MVHHVSETPSIPPTMHESFFYNSETAASAEFSGQIADHDHITSIEAKLHGLRVLKDKIEGCGNRGA